MTRTASIQNWEHIIWKPLKSYNITSAHRRGQQAFLCSVPSQPSSLSWPAGINTRPFTFRIRFCIL
jgi:hypothetical protein